MAEFHFSPRPNRANEIRWREWNADTFAEAEREDKPILLAISAVWCHWCHVMDETTYSDSNVIQLVNANFIPVRVDNDARPDINRRYNLGGWPTTAFLTPDGELLTGGTYIPPEQMQNYLTQVGEVYHTSQDQIRDKIAEIHNKRAALHSGHTAGFVDAMIVENVTKQVLSSFDPVYGGFGEEIKFPATDVLEFLLDRYFATHEQTLINAATLTLDQMANGGMYDRVWGGFYRYSTTRDWRIPHYEKMLEDNAKLLSVYVHAYQVTGHEDYLKTIRSLIAYVDLSLSHPDGGFYGSQDADETFYTLPAEERAKVAAPYVDNTFYTDWNALMISAYLNAAYVLPPGSDGNKLECDRLQSVALKTLDRLWNEMFLPGQGLYHSQHAGSTPQLPGLLVDLARTTAAFIDAYQGTGDNLYLQRAGILADHALATLRDDATGTFWSDNPQTNAPGLLRIADRSIGDNAVMADALLRLYRLNGNETYQDAADKALVYFAGEYEKLGYMAAEYARAIDHLINEPVAIHIVGPVDSPATQNLQAAALKQFAPDKVVQVLDPVRDNTRIAQLGYPLETNPLAYVCVGTTCLPPVGDPQAIPEQIQRFANQR